MTGASDSLTAAGSLYIWIYGGLICCAVGGLLWWRRHNYTRGPRVRDLNPLHVALLNGGTDRAIAASLGALCLAGAVRVVDGSLRQDALPHELASPLDLAVYAAVGRGHSPQSMSADRQVRPLIGGGIRVLVDGGLALSARERRLVREATIPVFTVALLGLAVGLAAFDLGDHGTGVLLLEAVAVSVVTGALFLRVDPLPARTRAFLIRAREEAAFLSPAAGPDWTAHGPETAGLAVAVFGLEVLEGIDPRLLALCTRWHGKPVVPADHPVPHSTVDGSMYSGGPTGPIHWYDSCGSAWGSTGGDSWGTGDGGFSGDGDGGGSSGGDGGGGS